MKLTSRGRYAIQAILDLMTNSQGRAVKLQDIATRQNLSLHYLEQLFRQLRQGEVVKSVRGPGGGYVLAKPASEITVATVLTSVKEQLSYGHKTALNESSTPELKLVAGYLKDTDTVIENQLNKTLEQLLGA